MFGVLSFGIAIAILFAYFCTEFLMTRFDIRQRVLVGKSGLPAIFAVNLLALVVVWAFVTLLAYVSVRGLYVHAAVIAIAVQIIWLVQHVWFYHRDHLRVSYEN